MCCDTLLESENTILKVPEKLYFLNKIIKTALYVVSTRGGVIVLCTHTTSNF